MFPLLLELGSPTLLCLTLGLCRTLQGPGVRAEKKVWRSSATHFQPQTRQGCLAGVRDKHHQRSCKRCPGWKHRCQHRVLLPGRTGVDTVVLHCEWRAGLRVGGAVV